MALRKILQDGEPTLRKKSREVTKFDSRLWELIDDLTETLRDANGLGLAAPQVGVLRRVAVVMDDDGTVIELINPVIAGEEGELEDIEGCLSFPQLWGLVTRPQKVTLEAVDRHGKSFRITREDMVARAFCHETEHLDGELFTDKVTEYVDIEKLREEGRVAEKVK